jgi:tetratricopeptide (TPR) repeat protein
MSSTSYQQSIIVEIEIDENFIKLQISPRIRARYQAALNWLTKYNPLEKKSNLEKVKGYIEAFYLLYDVPDLSRALKIILAKSTSVNDDGVLHIQLGSWGYYGEQIELYKKLIGKFDLELNSFWLASISSPLMALGKYDQAVKYCQEALDILQNKEASFEKAFALVNIGNSHYLMGNFIESIKYQEKGLKYAKKAEDQGVTMNALVGLGNSYQAIGEYKLAIKYYKKSLEICNQEMKYIGLSGSIIGNLGNSYNSLGDYESAVSYHQQSFEIAQKSGDISAESSALLNLGVDYSFLKNHESAIEYCQKSLIISRNLQNPYAEILGLLNLANAYVACEDYTMAINYQKQGLLICCKIQNPLCEGLLLVNLGNSYYFTQRFSEAINNYDKALQIMRTLLNSKEDYFKKPSIIEISNNVTRIDKGAFTFHLLDRRGEAVILGDIGNSYMMLKQFERAAQYVQEALGISREIKDREIEEKLLNMLVFIYRSWGKDLASQGNYEDGIKCINQSNAYVAEFLSFQAYSLGTQITNQMQNIWNQFWKT